MSDKIASYVISFDGDTSSLSTVLAAFKNQTVSTLTSLQATASKIDLFKSATAGVSDAKAAFASAQAAVKLFADQVTAAKAAGQDVGVVLAQSLKTATTQATAAGKALASQTATVDKLGASLTKAGVNVGDLALEQRTLAIAISQATAAAADQAAAASLGIKTLASQAPLIASLTAAYETLKASGTLSAVELQGAFEAVNAKIAAAEAETVSFGGGLEGLVAPASAVAIGIGLVGAAVGAAVKSYNGFNDALLKGSATATLSGQQLDALGDGARQVALDFGVDAQQAVGSLFALIRQGGVPASQAVDALRVSAAAAQANFADLSATVGLGTTILAGYGKSVGDLPLIFDQITAAAKLGGFSVADLGSSIGTLLPIAKAANVPIDELLSALTTLSKAGLDAGSATSTLSKFIQGLANPDTVSKLQQVGITVNGLFGTIQQIAAKNLDLGELLGISGDAKSVKDLAALTTGFQSMANTLRILDTTAQGTVQSLDAVAEQTEQAKVDKLAAAFDNLKSSVGKAAADTGIITFLTNVANQAAATAKNIGSIKNAFDVLPALLPGLAADINEANAAIGGYVGTLKQVPPATAAAAAAAVSTAQGAVSSISAIQTTVQGLLTAVNSRLAAANAVVANYKANLTAVATDLEKQIAIIQAQQAVALKALDDGTKASLEALQTQNLSQQALATQSLAVTTAAEAQRLKILQTSSAQVIAVFNVEAATQLAAASGNAASIKATEQQLAVDRKKIIDQYVADYQAQITQLTTAEAGYIASIKSIDQQRLDFNRDIQNQIDAVFAQGQGRYEAYGQKISQIEATIALARQANAAGEVTIAENYTKEALGLINGIGAAVSENGQEVVSAQSAALTKTDLLEQAQAAYNVSLGIAKDSAEAGAAATAANLATAKAGLAGLTDQQDALSAQVAKGITEKVDLDVSQAASDLAILNDAITTVARLVPIQLDLKNAQSSIDALSDSLKNGIDSGAQLAIATLVSSLGDAAARAPELAVKIDGAQAQIQTLVGQITDLSKLAPALRAVVNLDDAQAQKDLNALTADRTVTVHVRTVNDGGGGNPAGDSGGTGGDTSDGGGGGDPGFNKGGLVGRVQRFARGGPVFSGRKVPGVGNRDTFGAKLESGSFVMRKAASAYYGDGLLGAMANGIQRFAGGGLASVISSLGKFTFPAYGVQVDLGAGGTGNNPDVQDIVSKLQVIQDSSRQLTQSSSWLNLGTWAAQLADHVKVLPPEKVAPIRTVVDDNYQNFLDAIANATTFGVPATVGPDLLALLFAQGGSAPDSGTDTVPALLTPGEWVMKRGAVSKYGLGLMQAMNSMSVPREHVARMLAPPRVARFADGGLVAGSGADVAAPASSHASNITQNVNVSVQAADLFSEGNVRRFLMPVLETFARRKR